MEQLKLKKKLNISFAFQPNNQVSMETNSKIKISQKHVCNSENIVERKNILLFFLKRFLSLLSNTLLKYR